MSTLDEALNFDRSGYKPVEAPQTQPKFVSENLQPIYSTMQRTPLPPTFTNPDSQRNFYQSGKVPQFRIAAPFPTTGKTTINNTTNVSSSSVATSSVASSGASDQTIGYVTAALDVAAQEQGKVVMSKTVTIKRLTVDNPARVRLYSTSLCQLLDASRGDDPSSLSGTSHGVIMDVWLDDVLTWVCSPAPVGGNCDDPDQNILYLTVDNIGSSTTPITVSLNFVGEEV